jgi:rhodanese-related sulfurtransferase
MDILPKDFSQKLQSGEYVLLDVRTLDEYNSERIKNAILVDFFQPDFMKKVGEFDKNKKYLIYCRSGARGTSACEVMARLGFQSVDNLSGGILAWTSQNYEVVK